MELLRYSFEILFSFGAHLTIIAFKCHTVNCDEGDFLVMLQSYTIGGVDSLDKSWQLMLIDPVRQRLSHFIKQTLLPWKKKIRKPKIVICVELICVWYAHQHRFTSLFTIMKFCGKLQPCVEDTTHKLQVTVLEHCWDPRLTYNEIQHHGYQ